MTPICPECFQGKHGNCDGTAYLIGAGEIVDCECLEGTHPLRPVEVDPLEDFWLEIPSEVPPNEPGIWTEAFPDIEDEDQPTVRVNFKGHTDVIRDLYDVEIQNDKGVWVPIVPMPARSFLGVKTCLCGKNRTGNKRYQEHYAYAHIMGMED